MKNLFPFLIFIILSYSLFSCAEIKPLPVYFNNIRDTTLQVAVDNLDPIIQKNDLLSITVSSPNPEATIVFNPSIGTSTSNSAQGYLVNQDGTIHFPFLGIINAAGIRKKQLEENITRQLLARKLLIDPIVTVRYLNFQVTVVGEVARPAVIPVPDERINIIEAIGLAGDLTQYGKMDNVLLVREEEGKKITRRLNLNSPAMLTSPYYYLKSNDIIYVEPTKEKAIALKKPSNVLPVVISSISLVVLLINSLRQ